MAGLATVVALMLVGCGPDRSPQAKLQDAGLLVALCDVVDAAEVEFLVGRDGGNPYEGEVLWKITGSHRFEIGDVVTLGDPPTGMRAEGDPADFDPATDGLAVRVTPKRGSDDTQASWWAPNALSGSAWSSGKTEPCS